MLPVIGSHVNAENLPGTLQNISNTIQNVVDTAECDLSGNTYDSMTVCNNGGNGGGTGTVVNAAIGPGNSNGAATQYVAVRSYRHSDAVMPIYAWNSCYWINNGTDNSLFVPFKSSAEWSAFLGNRPLNINAIPCALPYSATGAAATESVTPYQALIPNPGCTNVTATRPNVYGKAGSSVWPTNPAVQTYTCHSGAVQGSATMQWNGNDGNGLTQGTSSWTTNPHFSVDLLMTGASSGGGSSTTSLTITAGDTVTFTWTATGSVGQSWTTAASGGSSGDGWAGNQSNINNTGKVIQPHGSATYTLTATDVTTGLAAVASIRVDVVAACGTDNGQSFITQPTNLCTSTETASAISGTSTGWSWSCSAGGGTPTDCSATLHAAQCGTNLIVNSSGSQVSGTACVLGLPSAVNTSTGGYTCTTSDPSTLASNSQSCTAAVANACVAGP